MNFHHFEVRCVSFIPFYPLFPQDYDPLLHIEWGGELYQEVDYANYTPDQPNNVADPNLRRMYFEDGPHIVGGLQAIPQAALVSRSVGDALREDWLLNRYNIQPLCYTHVSNLNKLIC